MLSAKNWNKKLVSKVQQKKNFLFMRKKFTFDDSHGVRNSVRCFSFGFSIFFSRSCSHQIQRFKRVWKKSWMKVFLVPRFQHYLASLMLLCFMLTFRFFSRDLNEKEMKLLFIFFKKFIDFERNFFCSSFFNIKQGGMNVFFFLFCILCVIEYLRRMRRASTSWRNIPN